MTAAVRVMDLSHTYSARGRKQPARDALKHVSFQIEAGSFFALLGPNGGGKSTTFQILTTLLTPTAGHAYVGEADVVENPESVRRQIGVVFQNPSLDKKLTVEENLRHQGHLYGLSGSILQARIGQALVNFNLTERREEYVETLSGGLKRRVEIAKSLLHEPRVLLLDEPTTGLDPRSKRDVQAFVREVQREHGASILLTTHDMDEAELLCDRISFLSGGRIVAEGTPVELREMVANGRPLDTITMETVFMELTGRRVEEDEMPEEAEKVLVHG